MTEKNKQKAIANELGIPFCTLGTLLKNRHDIEQSGLVSEKERPKVKHGKCEELENVLLEWFQ